MNNHGVKEGVARGLSQACVYGLEVQKTMLQVHGKMLSLSCDKTMRLITRGMWESVLTSGVVYSTYFSIYNSLQWTPAAGSVAAFTTGLMKVPISNCMRTLQAGAAPSALKACKQIMKAKGVPGLYAGYPLSVLEDTIELDLRTRLYYSMKSWLPPELARQPPVCMALGSISGMIAAWCTTPCDSIRAIMAVQQASATTGSQPKNIGSIPTAVSLWKKGGVQAMYRGGTLRASSNAAKSALFFLFLEVLQNHLP